MYILEHDESFITDILLLVKKRLNLLKISFWAYNFVVKIITRSLNISLKIRQKYL